MSVTVLLIAMLATTAAPGAQRALEGLPRGDEDLAIRILQAEDRRASAPEDIRLLLSACDAEDPGIRALAVRALGRLERPELSIDVLRRLRDDDPTVRAIAAFALGQLADRAIAGSLAKPLSDSARDDADDVVRNAAATALGRLPLRGAAATAARDLLTGLVAPAQERGAAPTGALRGLAAMVGRASPEERRRLLERAQEDLLLAVAARAPEVRDRRLAVGILVSAGPPPVDRLERLFADPDPEVRRRVLQALTGETPGQDPLAAWNLAARALREDPDARVRYAALETLRAVAGSEAPFCPLAREALAGDPSPHVRLLAVDVLGACPGADEVLTPLAASLEERGPGDWHEAAHALVALSRLDPGGSARQRATAAAHPVWEVRMYAARATSLALADPELAEALQAGERARLQVLARDRHPNVATEAIGALRLRDPTGLTDPVLHALSSDDEQLLMTAADSLEGIDPPVSLLDALFTALERLSGRRRETARDARVALLRRIGELGDAELVPRIEPYLRDYDPAVASLAAEVVETWTGTRPQASPRPLAPSPFPSLDELRSLEDARFQLRMASGGTFTVRLWPFVAPTSAARFARLAATGAFDGLTFHRVVPNFVVQGLSPGANEYVGYGAYSRDEIGPASHVRGTVGISTRGRDTGDGQIFINLVDNERLDFDYTIFGEVVDGMEAVDAILEGAVVESVVRGETP